MKRLILLAAIACAALQLHAQKTIKGKVVDASTGSTLSNVTISFGANSGTTTNGSGEFYVPCGTASKIIITSVGYQPGQHNVKNCDDAITIRLQPSSSKLEEVEITTTTVQNKALLYQPSSITKLGTREIRRGTGLFLDDAINANVPGVSMTRRAVSSGQQFNIRGYGNGSRGTRGVSSNFDGQGYKVYLNGIPVTDAEGITVMDDIDLGSIGNVEVVKGPAGTLYGLAIAGVVNLKTIKPEKGKTYLGQDVLVGNYGLQRYTTQFGMGGERSSILLNYGHQKSDGFTIHNKSTKDFVNFAGDFTINAKQTINAYAGYSNSYDERSGELTVQQYENNDYSGNIEYIKRNAHSQVYTFRAGVGHNWNFTDNISNNTTVFGTAFNSNVSSAGGWTDKSNLNVGLRSSFDTRFTFKKGIGLNGITGVETQHQTAQQVGYTMLKDPKDTASVWRWGNPYYWMVGAASSNVYYTSGTTSLFTEWTLSLPKSLSITAGLGWSNLKLSLKDRFYNAAQPLKPTSYDTTYGNMFSPHLAINKVFNKQVSVYAAYSRAYKAPVSSYFFITYAPNNSQSGIINRNLKPEVGDQYEVGTKGNLWNGKLNYQLAFFHAEFKDKMTTFGVLNPDATATAYTYVSNTGKQVHNGVEALLKSTVYQSSTGFFTAIMPFANLTYSDFKYKDYFFDSVGKTKVTPSNPLPKDSIIHNDYSNRPVAGVPKWVANIGIDFTTRPGLYGNVTYMYRDSYTLRADGQAQLSSTGPWGPYSVASYSLLNAKLGYRNSISRHIDLDVYVGATNLTDTKYAMMVFINQIPDAYIAAPRKANYFGGVNLKYVF